MWIEFDSKLVDDDSDKYIKQKEKYMVAMWIQIFKEKNTKRNGSFYQWKFLPWKFLSITILDFVAKARKLYYPQTLLEECKYEPKKIKMENHIDDELERSSSDESDNDYNDETESDNEKDNDEFNE